MYHMFPVSIIFIFDIVPLLFSISAWVLFCSVGPSFCSCSVVDSLACSCVAQICFISLSNLSSFVLGQIGVWVLKLFCWSSAVSIIWVIWILVVAVYFGFSGMSVCFIIP